MLGSEILDVALGMIFIFLLLSLVASAVREAIESFVNARAVHLERGIREMLDDKKGAGFTTLLYAHPFISSLFRGGYSAKATRRKGGDLPNYIPARSFAVALIDVVVRGATTAPSANAPAGPITVAQLRASLANVTSPALRRVLLLAMDDAGESIAKVQANVEQWFNDTMDRVAGWYRRRTQYGLFLIAIAVAFGMNIDSVALTNHLWRSKSTRAALVAQAEVFTHDSAAVRDLVAHPTQRDPLLQQQMKNLAALDLPIGWDTPNTSPLLLHFFGLLVTTFAIALGAPFWFDALKRIMVIRSTIKPGAPGDDETTQGSGVVPPAPPVNPNTLPTNTGGANAAGVNTSGASGATAATTPAGLPAAASANASGVRGSNAAAAPAKVPAVSPAVSPATPVAFTPHEWADGQQDEGLL